MPDADQRTMYVKTMFRKQFGPDGLLSIMFDPDFRSWAVLGEAMYKSERRALSSAIYLYLQHRPDLSVRIFVGEICQLICTADRNAASGASEFPDVV